jgi:hypothetical protein
MTATSTASSSSSSSLEPPMTPSHHSITSTELRASREGALAALEGRAEDDFMDMSDDDDDDDDDDYEEPAIDDEEEEEDDVVIISLPPQSRTRKQKSTKESWFPLASFIDLRDDDTTLSWNWRNFIEVGGIS